MASKLSKSKIEKLAVEIRSFLLERELWSDVRIYFNGKAFSTDDGMGHYFYNDPDANIVLENVEPTVEYVSDIITMTFEGPLYDVLNYFDGGKTETAFRELLGKYGCFYELGYAWSLGVYLM